MKKSFWVQEKALVAVPLIHLQKVLRVGIKLDMFRKTEILN